ncbi:MAG: CPBP family intramembrane metalloprotease [Lachnospiraceae bacterium]|nr:CPBP family intramembrane metalloprotease [Lachnospiraceae bacterium]
MNSSRIFSLYKKEILDVLRDKKTLVVMILVPLFLYPGIMMLSLFVMGQINKESLEKTYEIGLCVGDYKNDIEERLRDETDLFEYLFHVKEYADSSEMKADLSEGVLNASVEVIMEKDIPTFEISYIASKNDSATAASYVEDVLVSYKEQVRMDTMKALLPNAEQVLNPMWIKRVNVDSTEASLGSALGMFLPMILITSILMGAIYPAIDVTAGERERGTLETLMTIPVRISEVMTGKFLAVATIAIFSAVLNLGSMILVGLYMFDSIRLMAGADLTFSATDFIPSVLVLLAVLPIFALLVSAVCLCICIFAKSFKEANNYSTPILLVFMFASMAGILPNLELNLTTAFIPIVNIALLIKAVFVLRFDWTAILIVAVSSIIYSVLSIWFMSKLFSSEAILFGEGFSSIRLFESRKNMKKGQMPGVGDNILMFGSMLLVMLYLSTTLLMRFGIWGTAICQAMIFLIPVGYAWYMKADLKKLFSVKIPSIAHLLGGVCLWVGVFAAEQIVLTLLAEVFPAMVQTSSELNDSILQAGFLPAFFVVSICPALAEEAAFRGFLFGSLNVKYKPWIAIVVSALAFGLYHMNLLQFFGGAMMGVAIGYACYKSRSIFVGVLMHFINNGLSVVLNFNQELLAKIPILGNESYKLSDYFIFASVTIIFVLAGIIFLKIPNRRHKEN